MRKSDTGKFILSIMYDIFFDDQPLTFDYISNKFLDEIIPTRKCSYKIPYKYQDIELPMSNRNDDDDADDIVEATPNRKRNNKSRKKKTSGACSTDSSSQLPSNIREFTLPDGSVVYINTEETEMTEESVIDSIINTK